MFLLQGFALSVLLLYITHVFYKIPFDHAVAGAPDYDVKLPAIDDRIPAVPVFFLGYLWAYAFWFFAPFFVLKTGKQKTWDLFFAFTATMIVCSAILYIFPTNLDRVAEGLWDPEKNTFFWRWVRICYNMDGGLYGHALLPSLHCSNCAVFYLFLRDNGRPRWVRPAALFSTLLVAASTLLIKQHYFLDAVTGLGIPLLVTPLVRTSLRRLRSRAGKEAPAAPGPSSEA